MTYLQFRTIHPKTGKYVYSKDFTALEDYFFFCNRKGIPEDSDSHQMKVIQTGTPIKKTTWKTVKRLI